MTCKDCGYQRNSDEVSCPRCGSRLTEAGGFFEHGRQVKPSVVVVITIILCIVIGLLQVVFRSSETPHEVAREVSCARQTAVETRKAEILRQVERAEGVDLQQELAPPRVKPIPVPAPPTDEAVEAEPVKMLPRDAVELDDRRPQPPLVPSTNSPAQSLRELDALAAFRKRLAPDIAQLDFQAAQEKVRTEQQTFTTQWAVSGQAALQGLLTEAEAFHLWLSKEVVGFRLSRGGVVETSDCQTLRFSGTSMPWSAFYQNKVEYVGDMINNLVLSAMATKNLAPEEKGLLLIQTSAFLSLYYPEKVHANDKTEEILALVLENCTNHVAKVQSLFPEFYDRYTNGTYLAKVHAKELRGLSDIEQRTGRLLVADGSSPRTSSRPTQQQAEPPTEAAAIKKATDLVTRALSSYPVAREARYVAARTVPQPFNGESMKRFSPRLLLTFNFRYQLPSGHERWNLGPVNMAYDLAGKRWVMMGFCEATITGQNFLDTQEGQQAVHVAVKKAVQTDGDARAKNAPASSTTWKKSDLRSYDSRHPKNK